MKKTLFAAVASAVLVYPASAEVDCVSLSLSVKNAVSAEESKVLEIVTKEVSAAQGCACEIVKAAIEGSSAKPEVVASIVEAAVNAAPDQIRLIAQCAIAVAPDALSEVQAVLAKFDPNTGESVSSAKSAKSGKSSPAGEVASMPNPLDFPGTGPVGPSPGTAGGTPLIPLFPPVIINPPDVTRVDP